MSQFLRSRLVLTLSVFLLTISVIAVFAAGQLPPIKDEIAKL